MGIVFVSYIYIKFLHTCINDIFLAEIKKNQTYGMHSTYL